MSQPAAAASSTGAAYKKVIGGGLRLKGGPAKSAAGAAAKRRTTATGAPIDLAAGTEKALGLDRKSFKKEEGGVAATPAAASSSAAAPSAASSLPPPPVVLADPAAAPSSSWGLHKHELHEIDANLAVLREQDRAIERLDAAGKKERVASEKRAIEAQVAVMVQQNQLAPGIKFSVPDAASLNREYLYRKEASVSDATARLNARAGKKADRYCK